MQPLPARFRRQPLVEQLADHLRTRLLQGEWPARLPSERALSEGLNVSRSLVRRALHRLAGEGLLQTIQGHPAQVLQAPPPTAPVPGQKRVALLFGDALHTAS